MLERSYRNNMKIQLALTISIAWMPALAEEPTALEEKTWSQSERDEYVKGCVRGIAEPAYDGYLKRNNLSQPSPEQRERVIELATAPGGVVWGICDCFADEIEKHWELSEVQAHQDEVTALIAELGKNGKCVPAK